MDRKDFFLADGSINMQAAERAARASRGAAVRDGARIFWRGPSGTTDRRR